MLIGRPAATSLRAALAVALVGAMVGLPFRSAWVSSALANLIQPHHHASSTASRTVTIVKLTTVGAEKRRPVRCHANESFDAAVRAALPHSLSQPPFWAFPRGSRPVFPAHVGHVPLRC